MTRIILLCCGILSSLFYIGMNIFIPPLFEGYSSVTQPVSELSAINAPTRPLWVGLAVLYIILFAAFGFGVQQTASGNKNLRIVAVLIFIYTIINIYWPPMHLRGNTPTLTDTLHIVWTIITISLMMLIIGFGAAALKTPFRIYTIITFVIFLTFGILTSMEAPAIPQNLPTPQIGLWERINVGAFMLWVIVFAASLIQRERNLVSNSMMPHVI